MKADQDAKLKTLENENFKLGASLKMAKLKVEKLESEIQNLDCESNDLQKLCDEMIRKC